METGDVSQRQHIRPSSCGNTPDTIFLQNHHSRISSATVLKGLGENENTSSNEPSNYQELPPQLQAPNLTAHFTGSHVESTEEYFQK